MNKQLKYCIVSIVSEQTLPNILFIKEFQKKLSGKIFDYVFITTKEMLKRKKSETIIKTANINRDNVNILEVDEYRISDISERLNNTFKEFKDTGFIVNITGGTKIMSLSVYNFFYKNYPDNSDMFYIPLGRNMNTIEKIFPNNVEINKLQYRVNVNQYLSAYNVDIIHFSSELHTAQDETAKLFSIFVNDEKVFGLLDKLREFRRKGNKSLEELSDIKSFLIENNLLSDSVINGELSKHDIEYLTGGWFEEFIYSKMKTLYELRDEDIKLSCQIEQNINNNEIDVIFTKDNNLYVIECKTSLYTDENRSILMESIYKLRAITHNFGLRPKLLLVTLTDIKKEDKKLGKFKDAKVFGIDIIDKEKVLSDNFFSY